MVESSNIPVGPAESTSRMIEEEVRLMSTGELVDERDRLIEQIDPRYNPLIHLGFTPDMIGPETDSDDTMPLMTQALHSGAGAAGLMAMQDLLDKLRTDTPPEGIANLARLSAITRELRERERETTSEIPRSRRVPGTIEPDDSLVEEAGYVGARRSQSPSSSNAQDDLSGLIEVAEAKGQAPDQPRAEATPVKHRTPRIKRGWLEKIFKKVAPETRPAEQAELKYDKQVVDMAKATAMRMRNPFMDLYEGSYRASRRSYTRYLTALANESIVAAIDEGNLSGSDHLGIAQVKAIFIIEQLDVLRQLVTEDLRQTRTAKLGLLLDSDKRMVRFAKRAGAGLAAGLAGVAASNLLPVVIPGVSAVVAGTLLVASARFAKARAVSDARGKYELEGIDDGDKEEIRNVLLLPPEDGKDLTLKAVHQGMRRGLERQIAPRQHRARRALGAGALGVIPFAGLIGAAGEVKAVTSDLGWPWDLRARFGMSDSQVPRRDGPIHPLPSAAGQESDSLLRQAQSQASMVRFSADLWEYGGPGSPEVADALPDTINVSQYREVSGGLADGTADGVAYHLLRMGGVTPTGQNVLAIREVILASNSSVVGRNDFLYADTPLSIQAAKEAVRNMTAA